MARLGLGLGLNAGRTVDATAPTVSSATVPSAGTTLVIVFSEAVTGFGAGANGFTVTPSGGAATLTYSSGNGTATITFTTSRTIASGETVTRTYTPGSIADLAGNALGSFSGQSVTNSSSQSPATVTARQVQTNGTTLRLTFSAAVTGFASGAEGFAMTALTGGATTLSYSTGEGTTTVDFTISRTVYSTETSGVLAYTPGDILTGSNTLPVASFSAAQVTNGSTQVPIVPQVYRFNSTLADAAAGAKDLTRTAGLTTTYGTGKFSGCLGDPIIALMGETHGRAQDLLAGALNSVAYSVSCWFKATNNTGESCDIQFNSAGGVIQFNLKAIFRTTGGGGFEQALIGFNNNTTHSTSSNFAQGDWHHVAASVSGGLAQVWVDAVQVETNLAVPAGLTFDAGGTFSIVMAGDIGLDDLGIKQAALLQADVDALYASGTGALYPTS